MIKMKLWLILLLICDKLHWEYAIRKIAKASNNTFLKEFIKVSRG